ncbi:hypothetical protein [Ascidiimonas sp. W6]|uniref:hypothetical protein n=1 Tax=Ascidiimonas meishanensis TaxID=3128903 RepID=UPI0030EC01F6
MYKIIQHLTMKDTITEIIPSIGISLLISESFYKFGSFTLECIAFLSTFFVLGYFIYKLKSYLIRD